MIPVRPLLVVSADLFIVSPFPLEACGNGAADTPSGCLLLRPYPKQYHRDGLRENFQIQLQRPLVNVL